MTIAIMQPYFFPYIGYFQLMNAVDEFIVYDNIEYTKKGWINRNRILLNGHDELITLPIKKDSDFLQIRDRLLADTWKDERIKLLNKIREAYKKAPYFSTAFPTIEKCLLFKEQNLFNFIFHSLEQMKTYLNIKTKLIVSSTIEIDHQLKSEQKVIAICQAQKATNYINPIGGVELYDKDQFQHNGIHLSFLKTSQVIYKQFNDDFIPFLSIIDVMMFNSSVEIREFLNKGFEIC